ncbi:hypothetical protein TrST_g11958 [Triparma strigata]|uniref:30S ribosomal protein S15 n=1 Tax=Triparma strigata TaxID=1606541 RepID=A0A9W7B438_9STRA|nr:hypothetical protein TrST_g11958 [Triparma strigata]
MVSSALPRAFLPSSQRLLSSLAGSTSTQTSSILRHKLGQLPANSLSDEVKKAMSLDNASRSERVKFQTMSAIKEFERQPGDTGSTPVQIAALTVKIDSLASHCAINKKDHHNKRALTSLITRRRKLMQYLERKDFDSYAEVIKKLGLKALK